MSGERRVTGLCRRRPGGVGALLLVVLAGCGDVREAWNRMRDEREPVELPVLLSSELPFDYPPGLYLQGIHGEVTLRLFIDSLGLVVPESTVVAEPAAHAAFDSSAVDGSRRLQFRPARQGERRIGQTVLFPIKFRVPGVLPPPGDTLRPEP